VLLIVFDDARGDDVVIKTDRAMAETAFLERHDFSFRERTAIIILEKYASVKQKTAYPLRSPFLAMKNL
jgi:hypothetical protein